MPFCTSNTLSTTLSNDVLVVKLVINLEDSLLASFIAVPKPAAAGPIPSSLSFVLFIAIAVLFAASSAV